MTNEPLILAFDTTGQSVCVSLCRGHSEIESRVGEPQVSSSESLLPVIDRLLKNNRLSLDDIELLAVSRGPGSFAGIRVGLATAGALAFKLNCLCYGVSILESLALMAENRRNSEKLFTVVAAGKNQIYRQSFAGSSGRLYRESTEESPRLENIEEFVERIKISKNDSRLIVAGEKRAFEIAESFAGHNNIRVEAASDNVSKYVALKAMDIWANLRDKKTSGGNNLKPLYIRGVRIGGAESR